MDHFLRAGINKLFNLRAVVEPDVSIPGSPKINFVNKTVLIIFMKLSAKGTQKI